MNRLRIFLGFLMALPVLGFVSCSALDDEMNDDAYLYANAIVTVKTDSEGSTFFQLDDSTTLDPVGWKNVFEAERRALVNFDYVDGSSVEPRKVDVNWIEGVLTKDAVTTKAVVTSANDPVEIIPDWLTVCEDGYMTIHFATQWSSERIPHTVNLVQVSTSPYVFEFKHDKNGDFGTEWGDNIASFKIDKLLPETGKEYMEFKLRWMSFSGTMEVTVKYRTPGTWD